ncbi:MULTISPECIES: type III secretion system export apparatus subunit SctS [Cedecea]|uniref:Surface presentation of antigens protein SpaQ n=2 Tax=Cedecea davisae TaxID=158484 RepID=S3JZZ8_9ENTR|nr:MULTISPECIES: type III secretion system export apparatus subunit SctS [Cedecea]EPF18589.1 type III secretion protein, HrpO family [Cedecea davisae DSM 4568]MBU4684277.1 type III secretion system export apparatus subunit SctS [Cedecea davisae]MBU4688877.1 type III secretion system export apparatus subunit SctS [Cedecea davisae]QIX94549.1 type III secretion system export apparatus subunit SctS [Cedecea sp. FDAARGOS_727]
MDMIYMFKQAVLMVVVLSAPPLVVAVLVGIVVSLLQAVFQLQDQTLPFAIKLVAVGTTLALSGRWIGLQMIELAQSAFSMMAASGSLR